MKNYIIGIALALALVMGVVAFAETAEPSTDLVPAVTEEAPTEEAAPAAEAEKTDDNTALQEALEAYRSARESKHVDDLTEELNGYVEAGSMTQEQADLILNSMKERLAAKNGECPNCGYQFQNNAPQMGGQKGQRGGRMLQGGQMPGIQAQPNGPMNGQQQGPQR
jgi:predicted Zn-ribbon and HTH transcriptional regulator